MSLIWEEVPSEWIKKGFFSLPAPYVIRAKVPGGWFVRTGKGESIAAFFYPDPEHLWDGSALP